MTMAAGRDLGRWMSVEATGVRILLMGLLRCFGNKFHSPEGLVKNFFVCPVELKGLS
jgi:hypothetical protein